VIGLSLVASTTLPPWLISAVLRPPLHMAAMCAYTRACACAWHPYPPPMSRDNSLVSAAPSVCTLHTRTCPPFICRHSHLTTFLIQAGSHRPSIWLICVCTHGAWHSHLHLCSVTTRVRTHARRPRVALLPASMFCDNSLYPCELVSVLIPPVASTWSPHQC